jgi:Holliday junction DNA helicase RuvA
VFPLERQFVISFLTGTVHRIAADHLVVLTYGVGRKVHVTPETLASTRHGAEIELVTSLVVREDSLTLYGFGSEDENHTFEVLLTISGIGPRLAMAILSVMGPDELASAISNQDANALTRVPGIGKKGASRIILELENKLPQPAASSPGPACPSAAATSRSSTPSSDSAGRNSRPRRSWPRSSRTPVPMPGPPHCSRPLSRYWVHANDRSLRTQHRGQPRARLL